MVEVADYRKRDGSRKRVFPVDIGDVEVGYI